MIPPKRPLLDILNDIDSVVRDAYKAVKSDDGSEVQILSKAVVEIPILMNGLGFYVAEADSNVGDTKDERDHLLDTEVLQYMKTHETSKTEAESQIRVGENFRFKQTKYLEAERSYKRLKYKWVSVDKTMDGLRSRLSVIKRETENA